MSDVKSIEELRMENITEAKGIFEHFAETVEYIKEEGLVSSWEEHKDWAKKTELILATISLWSFSKGEHVFFHKRYLKNVVNLWKVLTRFSERKHEVDEWVRIYEERAKQKHRLAEIGERFVDFASSPCNLPLSFSFVMEHENVAKWGAIIKDFRKLLSVLAPVKVGIFHLPKSVSTDRVWVQNVDTGTITWVDKVLDSSKPYELIEDMKTDLLLNVVEHTSTIYLIILVHSQTREDVNLYGYLLWREPTGEISSEKLGPRKV